MGCFMSNKWFITVEICYKNKQIIGKYHCFFVILHLFHNCKRQLETGEKFGELGSSYIGDEYGYAITIQTPGNYFALNGKQYKFDNWLCAVRGSKVLYGIMNMKPIPSRGGTETNNYKYAVKMTFEDPKEDKGVARMQVYYLGPNYNLSYANAGYYCCNESFWNKLNEKDIIDRRIRVGADYWLNYDESHDSRETRSKFNKFSLSGIVQGANTSTRRYQDGYFLPWLKEPAW